MRYLIIGLFAVLLWSFTYSPSLKDEGIWPFPRIKTLQKEYSHGDTLSLKINGHFMVAGHCNIAFGLEQKTEHEGWKVLSDPMNQSYTDLCIASWKYKGEIKALFPIQQKITYDHFDPKPKVKMLKAGEYRIHVLTAKSKGIVRSNRFTLLDDVEFSTFPVF